MSDDDNKVGPPASDRGVYAIAVAAELSGISEQSLRLYERNGLITPARSQGGTRRYSADDLVRLQRISELVAAGVNLAGIARILSWSRLTGGVNRFGRRFPRRSGKSEEGAYVRVEEGIACRAAARTDR